MQKGHVFVFSVFFGFIFSSLCLCQVWTVFSKRAWRAPYLCSRDAVTTFARPCLFLWGVFMSLLSCRVTLWLSTSVRNCSMSTARARTGPSNSKRQTPRRCEYVMGLILHSALTICPLSVWLVAGVSSLKTASSLSGATKRFAFCFLLLAACDWSPWRSSDSIELCNMLPYMNTCSSCVSHAREIVLCRVAGVQGVSLACVERASKGEKVSACPSYFDLLRCMICCYLCIEWNVGGCCFVWTSKRGIELVLFCSKIHTHRNTHTTEPDDDSMRSGIMHPPWNIFRHH